jgi:hypothetical protein
LKSSGVFFAAFFCGLSSNILLLILPATKMF